MNRLHRSYPTKLLSQWKQFIPLFALLAGGVALTGCGYLDRSRSSAVESEVTEAEFGILFGGQLQERNEIPFELDTKKQQLGFRIDFLRELETATEISWELSKPAMPDPAAPQLAQPAGRVTKLSSAIVPKGVRRFEQVITLEPGDPLGVWNLRVTQNQSVLIDRPFLVFDRLARKRAKAATMIPDAGP